LHDCLSPFVPPRFTQDIFDMTDIALPLPEIRIEGRHLLPLKLAVAIALAALADWLFYAQRVGLSMALFGVVLFAASWLGNLIKLDRRRLLIATGVLVAGLIPAIEDLNLLSLLFVVAGLGFAVSILTNPEPKRLFLDRFGAFRDLFLIGPFRLPVDIIRMLDVRDLSTGIAMWLVPVVFGLLFVLLFASANPVIEKWINLLNPADWLSKFDLAHALFLGACAADRLALRACTLAPPQGSRAGRAAARRRQCRARLRLPGPLRRRHDPALADPVQSPVRGPDPARCDLSLGQCRAARRHQLCRLRPSRRLSPDRNALLAAGFVLAAMRPGGAAAARSAVIRAAGLSLGRAERPARHLLDAAALPLREIYMLTGWRIAALVWMLLVAIGLVLIVARIVLGQTNGWLVRMNLISLTRLYMCAR
jgi:hypothetical protein